MKKPIQVIVPIPLSTAILALALTLLFYASPADAVVRNQRIPTAPTWLASSQTISTAWQDLGGELNASMDSAACLLANVVRNDTVNVRFRALAKHTAAGADEYSMPIETVGSAAVSVEPEYKELNVDADQNIALCWDTMNGVPLVQFQVSASAVNTTAGTVSAWATLGY